MTLGRATPGKPLRIPAGAYNAFCDVAEEYKRNGYRTGKRDSASGTAGPALIVQVKNNNADDSDLDAFAAVTAPTGWNSGPIPITLDGNEYAVNSSPLLNGQFDAVGLTTPADGVILITQEPIPYGEIGRAAIGGVTVALVDITNIRHDYAEYDGTTNKLTSSSSGRVRILAYSDSDVTAVTGEQLCLVHLQQATQKVASYTGLSAYDAATANGDFITMTTIPAGYTTLFTGSFPVGWYDVEIHGNGQLQSVLSSFAQLEFDKDTGFGFSAVLPAVGSSRMATSSSTVNVSTPYSTRFLHYVFDETDSYRLRAFVSAGNTFTGIATLTVTPTVRRANMTVLDPP